MVEVPRDLGQNGALASGLRINGIVLVVLLVGGGMGMGSVVYHWKAPGIVAEMKKARASVPAEGEARLAVWLEFGRGLIHNRLIQLRLSAERPWLVTHVVEVSEDRAEDEVWGVDLTDLSPDVTEADGMTVVVTLPAARLMGRGPISGDKARNVARYRPGAAMPDPNERAAFVVEWALERLTGALEKDIEGASLEVAVGASAREQVPDG